VRDPETFRREGIHALPEMLEPIWEMLHELAPECSPKEWADFRYSVEHEDAGGHDGVTYRFKAVGNGVALSRGPHGELVREFLFRPEETAGHDYLNCPEIVQDIARLLQERDGHQP
jgi:hypothetical protein